METAQDNVGVMIPGEQVQINYEAEARKMGWTPADEFKGDPSRHIDAETFYNRGQEMMPILKAQNKALTRRLEQAEKIAKEAKEFWSKAEERAYTRALEDIRREQEAAVEAGDVEAHRAASKKLDDLEKPAAKGDPADDAERRAEDFADWGKANKWYATDPVKQAYADSQAQIIAKAKGGFLDRADLDAVTEKVKAKFAEDFEDAEDAPRPRRPAVDGGGNRRSPTPGRTAADLPDGGAQMRRFIKSGYVKSEADYLKSYQW